MSAPTAEKPCSVGRYETAPPSVGSTQRGLDHLIDITERRSCLVSVDRPEPIPNTAMPTRPGRTRPGTPTWLRILAHTDRTSTDCWLWTRTRDTFGYGQIKVAGKPRRAHVIAYEQWIGPVPDGLELDHLCRVRHCVNPLHLEPVTHAENTRRAVYPPRRGTHCKYGHPLDVQGKTQQRCSICSREHGRASRARRKAS